MWWWDLAKTGALGVFVICAFSLFAVPVHIDRHAAIHASGTVASTGIMIDPETSKTVRVLSKSIYLPPVRRLSAYFYIHVEFPATKYGVTEWTPRYALWCYPKGANLAAEAPFFGLGLSTLDISKAKISFFTYWSLPIFKLSLSLPFSKEGTYKIDIHTRIPVPVELIENPGNKCILAEEGSVALSELRWELHLVPEWRWFNIFPRALVDEVIHALAVMGVSYEAPPGHGSTWHDGTDMPNGIEIHRRRSVEAFMQGVDAGAFINRTFTSASSSSSSKQKSKAQ